MSRWSILKHFWYLPANVEGLSHVPRCCCYFLMSIKNCNNQSHLHLSERTKCNMGNPRRTSKKKLKSQKKYLRGFWTTLVQKKDGTDDYEVHKQLPSGWSTWRYFMKVLARVINIENCSNCNQFSLLLLHIAPMLAYEKLWTEPPESPTKYNSLLSSIA